MTLAGAYLEEMIEKRFGKRGKKTASEELGISPAYLSDMCRDRRGISPEFAARIARVFGEPAAKKLYLESCMSEFNAALEADRKAGKKRNV